MTRPVQLFGMLYDADALHKTLYVQATGRMLAKAVTQLPDPQYRCWTEQNSHIYSYWGAGNYF